MFKVQTLLLPKLLRKHLIPFLIRNIIMTRRMESDESDE